MSAQRIVSPLQVSKYGLQNIIDGFVTVFIAELGDKTQLATMLFAADKEVSKWMIFFGASLALIATSAIGVLAGSVISTTLAKNLHYIAGVGFILIGAWTLIKA